jgi:hypothetical protein
VCISVWCVRTLMIHFSPGYSWLPTPLIYEGLRYPVIDTYNIPQGFCEVDVKLDDNGQKFDCVMVAGHVGYVASGKNALDTLQPAAEWFMFVKGDAPANRQRMFR